MNSFYYDVCDCSDGSLAITGIENDKFIVSRYDKDVKHSWTQIFIFEPFQITTGRISCACCGSDNDLIVSGSYFNNLFVMKLSSSNGNLLWDKKTTISDISNRYLTECPTSTFFVIATTDNPLPDIILLKFDDTGSVLSTRRHFGLTDHSFDPQSTSMKSDGGFLVSGKGVYFSGGDSNSGFTLNFDPDGNLLWGRMLNFDGNYDEEWGFGNCQTDDGDIVMVGHYRTASFKDRCYLAKWSSTGLEWYGKASIDTDTDPDDRIEWCYSCTGLPNSQGKIFVLGEAQGDADLFLIDKEFSEVIWRVDHSSNDFQNTRGTFLSRKGEEEDSVFTISSNGVVTKYAIDQLLLSPKPELCPSGDYESDETITSIVDSSADFDMEVTINLTTTSFTWTPSIPTLNFTTVFENSDPIFNCWSCFGNSTAYSGFENSSHVVCSNHGTCSQNFTCSCDEYYAGEECERPVYCVSPVNGEQCSGHGVCLYDYLCNCTDYELYSGTLWEIFNCFGFSSTTDEGCLFNGNCIDINTCNCSYGYVQENCSEYACFGLGHSSEKDDVCFSHGTCIGIDDCECDSNYSNPDCSTWECFGKDKSGPSHELCSGHGSCIAPDNCSCFSEDYLGEECNLWKCYDIPNSDFDNVCTGHGVCVEVDICLCVDGYSTSLGVYGPCENWNCGGLSKDDDSVCNSRGECVGHNLCSCKNSFEGQDCETWSCSAVDYRYADACNGKGKCVQPEECDCNAGFAGENCEKNLLYGSVMAPILSIFGFFVILVFLCCMSCAIYSLFACGILSCLLCIGLCTCGGVVSIQKLKMRKFDQLKDLDLLLKEQEYENDSSIAHLRVNQKLFEIPFDEIKTTEILGRGGSQSVVFKAFWRNEVVAFKCYKTRSLCTSQNDFDDFEKEVQILSSLNHPCIVRFFGATLKPPRVGIVMEYCLKGEILDFFMAYEKMNNSLKRYPVNEIIRLVGEIVSALSYCHSRDIIHRDLKCENVLICEKEHAKLMDFGLSRVVETIGDSQKMTKSVGTNIYMSPEVVLEDSYDTMCDVFSFAIMFYVLITGNINPYGDRVFRVEFKVASNRNFRPDLRNLDSVLKNQKSLKWVKYIIKRCWDHTPAYRLNMKQVEEIFREHLDSVDHTMSVNDMRRMSVLLQQDGGKVSGLEELQRQIKMHDDSGGSFKPERLLDEMNAVGTLKERVTELENEVDNLRMENLSLKEQMERDKTKT